MRNISVRHDFAMAAVELFRLPNIKKTMPALCTRILDNWREKYCLSLGFCDTIMTASSEHYIINNLWKRLYPSKMRQEFFFLSLLWRLLHSVIWIMQDLITLKLLWILRSMCITRFHKQSPNVKVVVELKFQLWTETKL